jgi:hypothetical protein
MPTYTRKYKIKGVFPEKQFNALPFGRQIDTLRVFENFKMDSMCIWLSQKRQTYTKAIREAVALLGVTEYYTCFHAEPHYYDDSFQFWYKTS